MSGSLYFCGDERRRAQLRFGGSGLTGIDFLEVGDLSGADGAQRLLRVTFVNPPAGGSDLRAALTTETVSVTGGDRVGTAAGGTAARADVPCTEFRSCGGRSGLWAP